jgi:hypothetical protein
MAELDHENRIPVQLRVFQRASHHGEAASEYFRGRGRSERLADQSDTQCDYYELGSFQNVLKFVGKVSS